MNYPRLRKHPTLVAALAAIALGSSAEAATIVASVTGSTTINVGQSVIVNLSITGWTDGEVDAVDFNVGFDQNVLTYGSGSVPTTGSFLDQNQQPTVSLSGVLDGTNAGGGVLGVTLDDTDLGTPNTGATQAGGTLGSITFTGGSLGTTTVLPSGATFIDPFDIGRGFFGTPITPSSLSYTGVDITVIPEPSTTLLALVGLALAGCFRRARSA